MVKLTRLEWVGIGYKGEKHNKQYTVIVEEAVKGQMACRAEWGPIGGWLDRQVKEVGEAGVVNAAAQQLMKSKIKKGYVTVFQTEGTSQMVAEAAARFLNGR